MMQRERKEKIQKNKGRVDGSIFPIGKKNTPR
jgi:hypothetical protein